MRGREEVKNRVREHFTYILNISDEKQTELSCVGRGRNGFSGVEELMILEKKRRRS